MYNLYDNVQCHASCSMSILAGKSVHENSDHGSQTTELQMKWVSSKVSASDQNVGKIANSCCLENHPPFHRTTILPELPQIPTSTQTGNQRELLVKPQLCMRAGLGRSLQDYTQSPPPPSLNVTHSVRLKRKWHPALPRPSPSLLLGI